METFLSRTKSALQIDVLSAANEWTLRGDHKANGVSGTLRIRFDSAGRFVRQVESDLGTTEGFDGESGWRTDVTGMPGAFDLSDLDHAKLDIYLFTGLWLTNPSLVEVTDLVDEADRPEVTLTVAIPDSPIRGTVAIDRETALPLRLETDGVTGHVVQEFGDFRSISGVQVPTRVTRTASGLEESRTTVAAFEPIPKGSSPTKPPYTSRTETPRDARFLESDGSVPIHFAPTGHILVNPTINGQPMSAFIFDTGAGQCGVQIDPPPALGLTQVGSAPVASILGLRETPIYRGATLRLGPLEVSQPLLVSMDFTPFEAYFGEPIGGIIGYDILRRAVIAIDIDDSSLHIHEPTTYVLPRGEWIPLRFQHSHPIVPAKVEGKPGLFRLDLGASGGAHGNVVFHGPAVRQHGFLEDRETQPGQLGTEAVALGQIRSFELAGTTFGTTDVAFSTQGTGLFADAYTTGNIGIEMLRGFIVVFDYSHERIALIPR